MRIPRNTVSAVVQFYKEELKDLYSESELNNIILWILEHQVALSRTQIITSPETRINESDLDRLEKMCLELKAHKPFQYVLGDAEFFGMHFKVNSSVLIPRPETEELVEHIIKDCKRDLLDSPVIIDIGTGSGCIAIALKRNIPCAKVTAVDVSEEALKIAAENAKDNQVGINFMQANILEETALRKLVEPQSVDIIVSNPPYVLQNESASLHQRVRDFEPATALFVPDDDPLLFYRKIAQHGEKLLRKDGKLWFECHSKYAHKVQQLLQTMHYKNVTVHADLSGLARVCEAMRA